MAHRSESEPRWNRRRLALGVAILFGLTTAGACLITAVSGFSLLFEGIGDPPSYGLLVVLGAVGVAGCALAVYGSKRFRVAHADELAWLLCIPVFIVVYVLAGGPLLVLSCDWYRKCQAGDGY